MIKICIYCKTEFDTLTRRKLCYKCRKEYHINYRNNWICIPKNKKRRSEQDRIRHLNPENREKRRNYQKINGQKINEQKKIRKRKKQRARELNTAYIKSNELQKQKELDNDHNS